MLCILVQVTSCSVSTLDWPLQVAFVLPVAYHVDLTNFNWTPLVLAFCLAAVLFAWFAPGCGARHWYHGKAHTLESTSVPPVVRGVPSMLHACMHACTKALEGALSGCAKKHAARLPVFGWIAKEGLQEMGGLLPA